MTPPLTRQEVARQLRSLADELDPPALPQPDDKELAHELLRAAGVREPHLTRLSEIKPPGMVLAWLGYLIETDYPVEHRVGYMIKRLDSDRMPPAGPHHYTVEDILPRLPRRLRHN